MMMPPPLQFGTIKFNRKQFNHEMCSIVEKWDPVLDSWGLRNVQDPWDTWDLRNLEKLFLPFEIQNLNTQKLWNWSINKGPS